MSPEKRQKALAIGLAALLGVVGLRYLIPALGSGGDGSSLTQTGRGRARTGETSLPDLVPLRLDALENKPGEFQIGRDPFRFYVPPKPAPPPPPPPPPPQPQQQPRPRPTASREPQPPPVDVTFLGSFGPDRGRIAVFSDGSDLYNARIGDVVKTHFVVDSIGFESVDLRFVNFPSAPAQRLAAGG